ncbi:Ycf66 family protein [Gloeothece verrucosa]|uniref:Ycf66 family protein n=1 Tax=Gloeothece verrucosa (strain PCC 7822) TaxID=497965 RepID=E0UJS4_GLOV7|nr:Ycf66 family protein [Gloeothece verrucosa]ADN13435.1 Ycf66 family protein [Gloeothece verrucosa PCC 7822]
MLPYILAIAIAVYSLILFSQAFFSPVIHRKDDFLWSGIGLFYALVLWLCAGLITGAVLLGQSAAVILIISFGWQIAKLRRAIAYPDQPVAEFSVVQWVQNRLGSPKAKKASPAPTPQETPQATPSPAAETFIPPENEAALASPSLSVTEDSTTETVAQEILETVTAENIETPVTVEPETEEEVFVVAQVEQPQPIPEETPKTLSEFPKKATVEDTTPAPTPPKTKQKKGFSWKNLFGFGKKPTAQPKPASKIQAIAQSEPEIEFDEPSNTTEPLEKTPSPSPLKDQPTPTAATPENSAEDEFETYVPDNHEETVIEAYRSPEEVTEETTDYVFEPFVADTTAETVIENQPELAKSEAEVNQPTPSPQEKVTPIVADTAAETVVENQPELAKSEAEVSEPTASFEEKVTPTQPVESKEIEPLTDKKESEVKEEKSDKTE